MQQLLSAFGIDWRLLVAQAVNFALVLLALWYFLYKPVLAMMARRQELIAKGVAAAEEAREKLAHADTDVTKRLQAADIEADAIVVRARESAQSEKARLLKEAETRAAAVTADAEAQAMEIASQARRESERDIARLSILAAEKILKEKYD